MSRLKQPVYYEDLTAMVDTGLDWDTGDELYFAPTASIAEASDYLTIDSYNPIDGKLTFS